MRGVAAEEHAATLELIRHQRVAGVPGGARDDLDVERFAERMMEQRWRFGVGNVFVALALA